MTSAARGGRNRAIDHQAVVRFSKRWPGVAQAALDDQEFPYRAIRHATAEAGIDQFLNLGCGKPPANLPNLHDVVPGRWVHSDADPEVHAIGHALLTSKTTAYLEADARDAEDILESEAVQRLLDLARPVCVLAVNLWHYVPDEDDPAAIMSTYMDALPSGSALIFAHACSDGLDPEVRQGLWEVFAPTFTGGFWPRPEAGIREFLTGLELLEPGLISYQNWRPDHEPAVKDRTLPGLGCVAIKP